MIAALIAVLVIVVLIAVFIGKNLSNSCAIWFFRSFPETNIVVVVFIAFAAGIITSLLLILIGKLIAKAKAIAAEKKSEEGDSKSSKKDKKDEATEPEKNTQVIEIKSEQSQENTENIDNN